MCEKAEKNTEKKLSAPGKPPGNGMLRLLAVQILHLFTKPITIKNLQEQLAINGITVKLPTLWKVIREIKEVPTPGYFLYIEITRQGPKKTPTPAYLLKKHTQKNGTIQ